MSVYLRNASITWRLIDKSIKWRVYLKNPLIRSQSILSQRFHNREVQSNKFIFKLGTLFKRNIVISVLQNILNVYRNGNINKDIIATVAYRSSSDIFRKGKMIFTSSKPINTINGEIDNNLFDDVFERSDIDSDVVISAITEFEYFILNVY